MRRGCRIVEHVLVDGGGAFNAEWDLVFQIGKLLFDYVEIGGVFLYIFAQRFELISQRLDIFEHFPYLEKPNK